MLLNIFVNHYTQLSDEQKV